MKKTTIVILLATFLFASCKTPQPISVTLDDLSLTIPAGFTEYLKDHEMNCGEGVNPIKNEYSKIDDKTFRNCQVMSTDVSGSEAEDHDYTTSRVLAMFRIFYSDLKADKFTYVEEVPVTIAGKKGILITYDDKSDEQPKKGEMIAVYHNKKVYMLTYNDFSSHFDAGKSDWETIKTSVKFK